MQHTTVYCTAPASDDLATGPTLLRATTGPISGLSMWNTIANVLRTRSTVLLAYETSDGEIYETADGSIYALKR